MTQVYLYLAVIYDGKTLTDEMKKVDTWLKVNKLRISVKLISCYSKATGLHIITPKYQLTISLLHK